MYIRASLHGGGGPQVGEVTRLGGVTGLSILISFYYYVYMIGGVTHRILPHLSGVSRLNVNRRQIERNVLNKSKI